MFCVCNIYEKKKNVFEKIKVSFLWCRKSSRGCFFVPRNGWQVILFVQHSSFFGFYKAAGAFFFSVPFGINRFKSLNPLLLEGHFHTASTGFTTCRFSLLYSCKKTQIWCKRFLLVFVPMKCSVEDIFYYKEGFTITNVLMESANPWCDLITCDFKGRWSLTKMYFFCLFSVELPPRHEKVRNEAKCKSAKRVETVTLTWSPWTKTDPVNLRRLVNPQEQVRPVSVCGCETRTPFDQLAQRWVGKHWSRLPR